MITSLLDILDALADQIRDRLAAGSNPAEVTFQVEPRLVSSPSTPTVDMYPADPAQEQTAYGYTSRQLFLTVRARINTPDEYGAQDLLLSMMDSRSPISVGAAIYSDRTLGGLVADMQPEGPSGYITYIDPGNAGSWLGCEWRTQVILNTNGGAP